MRPSTAHYSRQREAQGTAGVGCSLAEFKVMGELGKGAYGVVYRVLSLIDHNEYVLKKIPIKHLKKNEIQDVVKEAKILRQLEHTNIVKSYSHFVEGGALNIVMEYARGGDLQQYLNNAKSKGETVQEKIILRMARELAQALSYLHSHNIIHRDIKTLNVFLDEHKRIKLGDMGVSKIVSSQVSTQNTRVGTPLYLAPELVKHKPYSFKIDVWAMGCVLYQMCTLGPPFYGENLINLGYNIVNKKPKSISKQYSKDLDEFIMKLLDKNPAQRPSSIEAVNMLNIILKLADEKQINQDKMMVLSGGNEKMEELKTKIEKIDFSRNKGLEKAYGSSTKIKSSTKLTFLEQKKLERIDYAKLANSNGSGCKQGSGEIVEQEGGKDKNQTPSLDILPSANKQQIFIQSPISVEQLNFHKKEAPKKILDLSSQTHTNSEVFKDMKIPLNHEPLLFENLPLSVNNLDLKESPKAGNQKASILNLKQSSGQYSLPNKQPDTKKGLTGINQQLKKTSFCNIGFDQKIKLMEMKLLRQRQFESAKKTLDVRNRPSTAIPIKIANPVIERSLNQNTQAIVPKIPIQKTETQIEKFQAHQNSTFASTENQAANTYQVKRSQRPQSSMPATKRDKLIISHPFLNPFKETFPSPVSFSDSNSVIMALTSGMINPVPHSQIILPKQKERPKTAVSNSAIDRGNNFPRKGYRIQTAVQQRGNLTGFNNESTETEDYHDVKVTVNDLLQNQQNFHLITDSSRKSNKTRDRAWKKSLEWSCSISASQSFLG